MSLDGLRDLGLLGPLDVRFAQALVRLGGVTSGSDPIALGAALASRAPSVGDVGVDLSAIHTQLADELARREEGVELAPFPEVGAWVEALSAADALVRRPDEDRAAPLVLDGHDLYLERTWAYQQRLADVVGRWLVAPALPVDLPRLAELLGQLKLDDPRAVLQRRAIVTAAHRPFALVAGGPGTGKTAVVVKLLAALQQLHLEATGQPLRVRLAAPTGKAAARMSESIRQRASEDLPAGLRKAVQAIEASTIHRLLGWRGPTRFQHHADRPLPLDLLIVDEASMVDLPLMTKLLEAVPPHGRVLLLGDPDQLASVDVGSVFADLCRATAGPVSEPLREAWAACGCEKPSRPAEGALPLPGDAATVLTHTWRYRAGSGIEALALAVNAGDGDRALEVLDGEAFPDVRRLELAVSEVAAAVEGLVLDDYVAVAEAASPAEALERLRAVRVLGAHRQGWAGVDALNAHLEARVRARLGVAEGVDWYAGRPVMVTRNDHDQQLFNGDVGVVFPGDDGGLWVWFETADGAGRAVAAALLPEHETVFVTTVHKSQGSEFGRVVLVVGGGGVRRELVYTGVTRASEEVVVIGDAVALRAGVGRRTERMSRLAGRLLHVGGVSSTESQDGESG